MSRHYPGFDLLRILAAAAVVFSHSFLIAQGNEENEPFQAMTGEILGVYGVMIFFILSGFLVSDSALRSEGVWHYSVKRLRRIVPGFLFCTVFVAVVFSAPFAKDGIAPFLASPESWYQTLSVLLFQQSSLYFTDVAFYAVPGAPDSTLPSIANGVLWTIRLELGCYLLVGCLLYFRMLNQAAALVLVCASAFAALYYPVQVNEFTGGLFFLLPSFVAGIVLCMYAASHQAEGRLALASITLLLVLAALVPNWQKLSPVLFPLFATYPLLWFGQQKHRLIEAAGRWGDPSYGMYLWGWPIQQVVRYFAGPEWSGYAFFVLCIPFVVLAGYLSWVLVERRFLVRRPAPA